MNKTIFSLTAIACAMQLPSASAALIAGSDFSSAAVFTAGAAQVGTVASVDFDDSLTSTDDLNLTDNVTVTSWSFANTGNFGGWDNNAQVGMPVGVGPAALVTKINGANSGAAAVQPILGASNAGFASVSFSIDIPAGTIVDLSSVTWDSRMATGTATNVRWIAFDTSLDSGIIYSEVGSARPIVDSNNVDLSGAAYQGLTNTTVTFNWYAGGTGSGDQDFDTPTINGTVTQVPEPSAAALFGLVGLAAFMRRHR